MCIRDRYQELQNQLTESSMLLDDIVLKNYLSKLFSFEIIPLQENMRRISDIRLFKINEMVYQKDEYSTYKLSLIHIFRIFFPQRHCQH